MLYIKRLIGTEIIIPSILSKIPPCPGSNVPVFFIFASLFKYEKKMSPSCDNKQTEKVKIKIIKKLIFK